MEGRGPNSCDSGYQQVAEGFPDNKEALDSTKYAELFD
jgi:hypothetical protein